MKLRQTQIMYMLQDCLYALSEGQEKAVDQTLG